MPESFIPVWMSVGEAENFRSTLHELDGSEAGLPERELSLIEGALERERPRTYAEMDAEQKAAAPSSPQAEVQEEFGGGEIGKPTGTRCDSCDVEERVGDEGWESREGLCWCPNCFTEDPAEPQTPGMKGAAFAYRFGADRVRGILAALPAPSEPEEGS